MEIYLTPDRKVRIVDGDRCLHFLPNPSHSPSSSPAKSALESSETPYRMIPGTKNDASLPEDSLFIGSCVAIIGRFAENKLLVVKESHAVGHIPGPCNSQDPVFKVTKVAIIDPIACDVVDGNSIGGFGVPDPESVFHVNDSIHSPHDDNIPGSQVTSSTSRTSVSLQHQHQAKRMVKRTWNQIHGHIKSVVSTTTPSTTTSNRINASSPDDRLFDNPYDTNVPDGNTSSSSSSTRDHRRIMDQVVRLFNDTDSFYYCPNGGDLFNTIQRKYELFESREKEKDQEQQQKEQPNAKSKLLDQLLREERFFWNRFMLNDLIEIRDSGKQEQDEDTCTSASSLADHWITPVMQGFFQSQSYRTNVMQHREFPSLLIPEGSSSSCTSDQQTDDEEEDVTDGSCVSSTDNKHQQQPGLLRPDLMTMILISRRSKYMAGTRYKKRGLDGEGNCANYVETEQIIRYDKHVVSFVQVRGSVPVFWSQIGHRYRPPPKIDRTPGETQQAFEKHFKKELEIYSKTVIVNLVESNGRESVLSHAYLNHVLDFDCPDITYVSFDFHEYCRGMRFENVSVLIESISDIIRDMRFCWTDDQGIICRQNGVFRVNCVDCLDRTNVVQTALGREVMHQQFTRLGILTPESSLPDSWKSMFNEMWANNGDTLSRQYAGTAALKSDFTRTGERKFAGMVRDGVNSCTRYYQNRFKDRSRQFVIDLLLGETSIRACDDVDAAEENNDLVDASESGERMKQVMEDVKNLLIPETEVVLGSWPLIDADTDMDVVLILTQDSFYVAEYDEDRDRVNSCRKILLEDLIKMELGMEPNSLSSKLKIHKITMIDDSRSYVFRLFYLVDSVAGFFYAFKSTNVRFFNNMVIPVRSADDELECLKAILESFKVALSVKSLSVPVYEGRLERKKSRLPINRRSAAQTTSRAITGIQNVGSKAISGVSSQFARFKGRFRTGSRNQADSSGQTVFYDTKDTPSSIRTTTRGSESEDDPSIYSTSVFVKDQDDVSDADFSGSNLEDDDDGDHSVEEEEEGRNTRTGTTVVVTKSAEPTAQVQDSVYLSSCGILTSVSPPLKSLSDSDIVGDGSDGNTVNRKTCRTADSLEGEENDFSSLPPIVDTDARPDTRLNNNRMQATVSMVAVNQESSGTSSQLLHPVSSAVSCVAIPVALAPRKSDPEKKTSSTRQLTDSPEPNSRLIDTVIVPPVSPGALHARSTLDVGQLTCPSSGLKNSRSAAEMVSILLSPVPSAANLITSPLNRIAKGVQSIGLNISSSSNSPKKAKKLNNLIDSYDLDKKRKRNCKSRIIEL